GLGGDPAGKDAGGGLYIRDAAPTLRLVDVADNFSPDLGGGLYIHSSTPPIIENSSIRNNSAGERGGGLYIHKSAPTITGTLIQRNQARAGGGAYLYQSNASFLDSAVSGAAPTCHFDDNLAAGSPGYRAGSGPNGLPVLWLGPGGGGGLAMEESQAIVRGCRFSLNSALVGGGLYIHNSPATVEQSIIFGNRTLAGSR